MFFILPTPTASVPVWQLRPSERTWRGTSWFWLLLPALGSKEWPLEATCLSPEF